MYKRQAQKLADQLSQVEELEARLERMLEGKADSNPTTPLPLLMPELPEPPELGKPSLQGPEL